jgi:hypothetical protein
LFLPDADRHVLPSMLTARARHYDVRREELLLRKQLEGSTEIDWDEEKEKIYERLVKATAGLQLDTPIE